MKHGNRKLFLNRTKLHIMLNLRRCGFSLVSLAQMFGCDHKATFFQCEKYGVYPLDVPLSMDRLVQEGIKVSPAKKVTTINQGKMYAEYLKEDRRKRIPKHLLFLHSKL